MTGMPCTASSTGHRGVFLQYTGWCAIPRSRSLRTRRLLSAPTRRRSGWGRSRNCPRRKEIRKSCRRGAWGL